MHRLWALFWRAAMLEGRFIRRHGWEQVLLLWLPLSSVLLVWWIFAHGQIQHLPVGVLNHDRGPLASQLVRLLNSAPAIRVDAQYRNAAEAQRALDTVSVYGVVVIPADFSTQLKQGRAAPVVLQYNAQYGAFAGLVQRDVRLATATFAAGVEVQARQRRGDSPRLASRNAQPIRTASASLFNPNTDYQQFLASTAIPALLHILAMTVGASVAGRELRDRHLGHWLAACGLPESPAPRWLPLAAVLTGKLTWPMLLLSAWGGLSLWLATADTVGLAAWLTACFSLWLMLLVSLWLGVVLSMATLSLRTGLSLTGLITAPSFAFAGVTFPVMAMPAGAQLWAYCLPLTHYIHTQIALLQMGAPVRQALPGLAGFGVATVLLIALAARLTGRACRLPQRWGAR